MGKARHFLRITPYSYRNRILNFIHHFQVMTLFYAITAYTELAFGLGTPTGADNAVAIRLLDNIARTFALVAAAWAKTAFACSLLGLARDSRRTWWTLWFAIVSLNAVTVGVCVAHWLRCVPVNKAWDDSVASGRCWKKTVQNDVDLVAQGELTRICMRAKRSSWREE